MHTTIRNTIVMEDVHVGSNSLVTNSIIGKGTIINNNFSSINGTSTVEIEGEFKKLKNMGAMIGDDCNIGSNVIVDSGKIIGRNCKISSMKRIIDNISSNSKVM